MAANGRFPIRYSPGKGMILRLCGLPARTSFVELDPATVRARLGWAFSARIPRSRLAAAWRAPDVHLTAGAHGWRGHWLVNGARDGIVAMDLTEPVRARTCGFPIRLRRLSVSLEDPDGFLRTLGLPSSAAAPGAG